MDKSLFKNATFFTTVDRLEDLPNFNCLEVAFAGRSNVGKSSAINRLTNQSRLAYASKTPGRTQHINYFLLAPKRYLVDLPGYGYARVPENIRRHWGELVEGYLGKRESLCGLIALMDIRHAFTKLDLQLLDWFSITKKPAHILLTKSDKLTPAQARKALVAAQKIVMDLYPQYDVQLFSSETSMGVERTRRIISTWLGL
jgi:GTP-binding protein